MSETGLTSINQDTVKCAAQLREELQIISIVLHLVDPELPIDPTRIRRIVQHGHSALDRIADILGDAALLSASNIRAKIVALNAPDNFMA